MGRGEPEKVRLQRHQLRGASADSIGRGATLALRCTMCHGARGLSQANTPNLAGEYPVTIYKELVDFKTGARASAVMAPLVANLSDGDMRDLALAEPAGLIYCPFRALLHLPTWADTLTRPVTRIGTGS